MMNTETCTPIRLLGRVRTMMAYGLTNEEISLELRDEATETDIFFAVAAAKIVDE